ncbi:LysR family transcriptional regulator [Candidatus Pantoea multigeneris]|uniref:LysR family transcriptional regulator n=1 Tax=Candidatus Pantoea multigeneris TaxID=2608357 RepID=A0ABX0RC00_9GAMM|nr:LysR family transcriptional regulator [Pantoea multigeneris]NIF20770.1 LysR family transcriptional regulator [Pantoea multigeneris]
MDTRLLRAFVVLADSGSYREAAQKLFVTQPALTKQIQMIENELGMQLFVRGRHGAQLTPGGEQLVGKARFIVEQSVEFRHLAKNIASGKEGNLFIGFGIAGIKVAPVLIAQFRQRYPRVHINLEDMPSSVQTEELLQGRIQIAFMRLPVKAPLKGVTLRTESLVIAVKEDLYSHYVTSLRQQDNYRSLAELPLLVLKSERGPGLDKQVKRFLAFNQLEPEVVQEARDIQTLMALVAAGLGVAIVPESTVNISPEEVRMIPLNGPHTQWDLGVVWNSVYDDHLRDLFLSMLPTAS